MAMTWQVHIYRSAKRRAGGLMPRSRDVPLHIFDWRSEHEAAGSGACGIYLLRADSPTESATGATSLIVYCAFCDLGRQRQLVGLAQPGDHCEGDNCHRHQQEGWRKVIAASLYRVDGDHRGESTD